jgi:hypothetical protein
VLFCLLSSFVYGGFARVGLNRMFNQKLNDILSHNKITYVHVLMKQWLTLVQSVINVALGSDDKPEG